MYESIVPPQHARLRPHYAAGYLQCQQFGRKLRRELRPEQEVSWMLSMPESSAFNHSFARDHVGLVRKGFIAQSTARLASAAFRRSETRRVGKELGSKCRFRGAP